MATWESAKSYLASNYKCESIANGLKLVFELRDGRSQVILVLPSGPDDQIGFVDFHAPIGELGKVDLHALTRRTIDFSMGGISTVADLVTLRNTVPLENLDANEIEDPLHLITVIADSLEQEFTGQDAY